MFQEVLKEVVERTEGGVAGLLMGFDGIPIDQYIRNDSGASVETVGMEYSVILKEIKKAAEMLDAGAAQEVSIKAERLITVIRMVSDEYFVAMTLTPEGNLGKARFLLRTKAPVLAEELTF